MGRCTTAQRSRKHEMLKVSSDDNPIRGRPRRERIMKRYDAGAGHDYQYQLICRDVLWFRNHAVDIEKIDERVAAIRNKIFCREQWQVGTLLMRPMTMPLSAEDDRPIHAFPRTTIINPETLQPEVQIIYAICFYEVMQVAYQDTLSFANVVLNPAKTTIYSDLDVPRSMSASDMAEIRVNSLCAAVHFPNSFYTEIPIGHDSIHFTLFDGSIGDIARIVQTDSELRMIKHSFMQARATFNTMPATFARLSEIASTIATTPTSLPLEIDVATLEALPGGLSPYVDGAVDPLEHLYRQPYSEFKTDDAPELPPPLSLAEEVSPIEFDLTTPFDFNPFDEPDYTDMLRQLAFEINNA